MKTAQQNLFMIVGLIGFCISGFFTWNTLGYILQTLLIPQWGILAVFVVVAMLWTLILVVIVPTITFLIKIILSKSETILKGHLTTFGYIFPIQMGLLATIIYGPIYWPAQSFESTPEENGAYSFKTFAIDPNDRILNYGRDIDDKFLKFRSTVANQNLPIIRSKTNEQGEHSFGIFIPGTPDNPYETYTLMMAYTPTTSEVSNTPTSTWWLDSRNTTRKYFDINQTFALCESDPNCELYENNAGIRFAYFTKEKFNDVEYSRLVFDIQLPGFEPMQASDYDLLRGGYSKSDSTRLLEVMASSLSYVDKESEKTKKMSEDTRDIIFGTYSK